MPGGIFGKRTALTMHAGRLEMQTTNHAAFESGFDIVIDDGLGVVIPEGGKIISCEINGDNYYTAVDKNTTELEPEYQEVMGNVIVSDLKGGAEHVLITTPEEIITGRKKIERINVLPLKSLRNKMAINRLKKTIIGT